MSYILQISSIKGKLLIQINNLLLPNNFTSTKNPMKTFATLCLIAALANARDGRSKVQKLWCQAPADDADNEFTIDLMYKSKQANRNGEGAFDVLSGVVSGAAADASLSAALSDGCGGDELDGALFSASTDASGLSVFADLAVALNYEEALGQAITISDDANSVCCVISADR